MHYVYILKCKDGFYSGCTHDLKDRLHRHMSGYIPATKDRLPIELKNYVAFLDRYSAYNFEKYLKSGSGRTFCKKHFDLE